MIKNVTIKNYKSIKGINFPTSKVNVFIGEHNSGKSNIIEALSWLSVGSLDVFRELFRFKNVPDFFYDFDTTQPIEIKTNEVSLLLKYAKNQQGALLDFFEGLLYTNAINGDEAVKDFYNIQDFQNYQLFQLTMDGSINNIKGQIESPFRNYTFKRLTEFRNTGRPFLSPPFGENIPNLLLTNKNLKELISALFKEKGFRMMLKPTESDLSMAKDVNDELYSYPYPSISETIQRIVFFTLAIESNKNSILLLDEPESNTFPMYTKQMAEMIALDETNQYFITTHNPYILHSLISKTPKKDLSVFVTKMENYITTVELVPQESMSELLTSGADVFFNLDKLFVSND